MCRECIGRECRRADSYRTSSISMPYNATMTSAPTSPNHRALRLLLTVLLFGTWGHAQNSPHPTSADADSQPVGVSQDSSLTETPAETLNRCWQVLTDNVRGCQALRGPYPGAQCPWQFRIESARKSPHCRSNEGSEPGCTHRRYPCGRQHQIACACSADDEASGRS